MKVGFSTSSQVLIRLRFLDIDKSFQIVFAAVILNEHLTEALRRLRRDTAEHSVDRYVDFCTLTLSHS